MNATLIGLVLVAIVVLAAIIALLVRARRAVGPLEEPTATTAVAPATPPPEPGAEDEIRSDAEESGLPGEPDDDQEVDDGVVAARGCWRPLGAPPQWQTLEEPLGNHLARQRAEAGLGPPVQR